MYNLVKKNITEKKLISQGDNVLIGLSGGPDSVFLFHNLRLLKETLSFNLYASHINHMYRGEDADNDEAFVRTLCSDYGIKLFVLRKNAVLYAREIKATEEEAGRKLRYDFFAENLREIGGGKIAVAHNLNDQAETVIQRIIRGTGIDGLSAMTYIKNNIIRPILNIERSEIEAYLNKNNYEFCTDKTNSRDIYGRNKIRLNLIPYLQDNFNPNIQNTLFRMSEAMYGDSKIIEKYIKDLFNENIIKKNKNEVFLDLYKLKKLEDYELGRIVKRALELLKGSTINIEMKHINYADEFIKSGRTGQTINFSDGFEAEISYGVLIIRKFMGKFPAFKYNIIENKSLFIKETGQTICCRVLNASDINIKDRKSINLDYDIIKGSLTVRNRKNGDSMIPCGMTGNKKIKDIFIDRKVPAYERDKRLIITDEANILWVEGFRIHNNYKVSASTKRILNITITEGQNV